MRKFGSWGSGERRISPSKPLYGSSGVPSRAAVKKSLEREQSAGIIKSESKTRPRS